MIETGGGVPLSKQTVAVVTHAYTPPGGMAQELVEYLNSHAARVCFIVHPFPAARMPLHSTLQVFEQGRLIQEWRTPSPRGPSVCFYILDILFTFYLIWRSRVRVDLFIGLDNLNAFAGLVLRRMGLVQSVVFYVIDYVPQRFENRRLNELYHWIDRICCEKVDCIWNVSAAMMEARLARWGSLDHCAPSLVVPLGCRFERIARLPLSEINRRDVVFLGSLTPEQGVHLLLEAWPAICARVPDAKLSIIGWGSQETQLKAQARRLGIESSVRFLGFVADDTEVERILSRCAVGVAPYGEDKTSFKYYADPGKVKLYLAAGLPVVITRVPPIAQAIHGARAGFAINPAASELADAVVRLLTRDGLYAQYRANAIRFASQFSWEKIFGDALTQTLRPRQVAEVVPE